MSKLTTIHRNLARFTCQQHCAIYPKPRTPRVPHIHNFISTSLWRTAIFEFRKSILYIHTHILGAHTQRTKPSDSRKARARRTAGPTRISYSADARTQNARCVCLYTLKVRAHTQTQKHILYEYVCVCDQILTACRCDAIPRKHTYIKPKHTNIYAIYEHLYGVLAR